MLGYLTVEGAGVADAMLDEAAGRLRSLGWPLAGAVQRDVSGEAGKRTQMTLFVLASDQVIKISQELGAGATGCSLDPEALEEAVGLAEASLDAIPAPRLVIVNKFGKTEGEGRGFRPLIGKALERGIPVLVGVSPGNRPAFDDFAEGLDEPVVATVDGIVDWAERTVAAAT